MARAERARAIRHAKTGRSISRSFCKIFERGGGNFTNAVHSAGATARHARRAQAGGKEKEEKKKKKKKKKKNK
jgi:hypothetical protein